MLVSAVLDPSAFDAADFDELYAIQVEDLLRGIWSNGVLIVDSKRKLQKELFEKAESFPGTGKWERLRSLLTDLLKEKSKRVAVRLVSLSNASSVDLLELTCDLKKDTEADVLILGDKNFETLKFNPKYSDGLVPLSKYRDSDFEVDRQRYENQIGPIDSLPKPDVEDLIIRLVRFSKWLRFYDPYIGRGKNTSNFQKGIEYILSLWHEHGFFVSQQGIVEIFTCKGQYVQDQHQRIVEELTTPLMEQFPWPIKFSIKVDKFGADRIFHARYLETQHAIVRIDKGFDLFKQNDDFRRNFFTLNMAEAPHLKECRELPDADLGGTP